MKRLRILLVGLMLLALLGIAWLTKGYKSEILTAYTFVAVDAPADKAWAVLTDIESYSQWNPYIVEAKGTLKSGEKLKIVEEVGGKQRSHGVLITRFQPADHQLIWEGSTVPTLLLKWNEWFSVEPIDTNHCRLVLMQSNQGLLAQLYWKYNKNSVLQAYRDFGSALKKKAEQ